MKGRWISRRRPHHPRCQAAGQTSEAADEKVGHVRADVAGARELRTCIGVSEGSYTTTVLDGPKSSDKLATTLLLPIQEPRYVPGEPSEQFEASW